MHIYYLCLLHRLLHTCPVLLCPRFYVPQPLLHHLHIRGHDLLRKLTLCLRDVHLDRFDVHKELTRGVICGEVGFQKVKGKQLVQVTQKGQFYY